MERDPPLETALSVNMIPAPADNEASFQTLQKCTLRAGLLSTFTFNYFASGQTAASGGMCFFKLFFPLR